VQAPGQTSERTKPAVAVPHWLRGLALVCVAGVLLETVSRDLAGFPRAALLLALYVLVLAAAADVVWHVLTSRKPAPIAALTGTRATVPSYGAPVRMWVTGIALGIAGAVSLLHGADALSVLRAWAQLHRWAPPVIAARVLPATIDAHQTVHVTVTVDNRPATGYRCEWQGRVGEWTAGDACDLRATPPAHFVEPDWPSRRIAVSARVFDGDRFLGTTPRQTLTINYAPAITVIADRSRILQGQPAQFRVEVDGHPPGADDHCRWTVADQFVSSESCTFVYSGSDARTEPEAQVPVRVEVENVSNGTVGSADASLVVEQPQLYSLYLLDASKRMAGQTVTGTFLDDVKGDLVDAWSSTDLAGSRLGIATFGAAARAARCFNNVQVPYPLQRLDLNLAKSTVYLIQPGGPQAPFATAVLRALTLLRPSAAAAGAHAWFVLISIAGGQDTCAAASPETADQARQTLIDAVREAAARAGGRLLALTIGVGTSDAERRAWDDLARSAPAAAPYVVIPASTIPVLDQALRAAAALGGRDYAARVAACADLSRMLQNAGLDAGGARVDAYCRTLAAP
jgi:hypothetical protein